MESLKNEFIRQQKEKTNNNTELLFLTSNENYILWLEKKLTDTDQALQLLQTGVKQSVFYSIVDNGTVLEKFKEKETAEYALDEYKRMGFPYATILETVA